MLEVKAYVRENMLDKVVDKLSEIPGVPGIMVGEVIGIANTETKDKLVQTKLAKLELDIPESLLKAVVNTIIESAKTRRGHPGDGKIIVTPVNQIFKIAGGSS
ncbi:MAG: P-II family nitrogen regulator [Gammaproteobacteria bacterium]